ncbi:DNA-binding response regulator [Bryobacterales bacterium F-183]|nr:DNA-binding response regulator [Bryobacterales bacterium F-183]
MVTNGSDSATLIRDSLSTQGFRVEIGPEFTAANARVLQDPFALVLLDASSVMQHGAGKLREIRKHSAIPVIVVIATNTADVRSAWLEAGADDCIAVPVHIREVVARIRAVLRRDAKGQLGVVEVNGVRLNVATRDVEAAGSTLALTTVEFDVLAVLMRSAGHPVSRDHLMEALHQRKATAYDRSIDMHVSNLRKKLASAGAGPNVIKTVRGAGYQFCPSGEAAETSSAAAAAGAGASSTGPLKP